LRTQKCHPEEILLSSITSDSEASTHKGIITGNEPPLNEAHTIYSGQKERADIFMETLLVFRKAQVSPLSGQLFLKDNAFLHISA
jgi:hypothetical protein